jgi:hypothetical protein
MGAKIRVSATMLWVLTALIAFMTLWVPSADATPRNFPASQGWASPSAATVYDDWDFNQCTAEYFYWGSPPIGRTHLGTDSQGAGSYTTVRAMADGVIVRSETGWPGQAIGVVHYTSTGEAFMAVYGHLAGAITSGTVSRNQAIGTTEGTVSHLHLGIRPLSASEAASYLSGGAPDIRGQGDASCPSSSYGYVDPIPWLAARSPGSAVTVDPEVGVTPSLGQSDPLTTFTFTGSGFTPNGDIYETVYNPNGSPYAGSYTRDRVATATGAFSGNVLWFWESGDPHGRYQAVFEDVATGQTDAVYFTIAEEPTLPFVPSCLADQSGRVVVGWSAAMANGSAVTGYEVQTEVVATGAVGSWTSTGMGLQRVYDALPLGVAHRFRVRASNAVGLGTASAWSTACTPEAAPAAPTGLNAAVVGSQIEVDWTAPASPGSVILEYDMVWEAVSGADAGSISTGVQTSWSFLPPNPTEGYRFQVAARNETGWGPYSAWTSPVAVLSGPIVRVDTASMIEGDTTSTLLRFPVSLSAPGTTGVKVGWRTVDLTAWSQVDYVAASGVVSLPRGTTLGYIDVWVVGDTLDEPEERIGVLLYSPYGATLHPQAYKVGGGILDDDPPPHLVPGFAEVVEGNLGTTTLAIPVNLSQRSGKRVSVDWTAVSFEASVPGDVLAASGTLVFPPGATTAEVRLTVVGDHEVETDEWVQVDLSNPVNVEILAGEEAAFGRILDDADIGATVPDPPTGVGAASGLDSMVRVSWSAPAVDGGLPISGYEVQLDGTTQVRTDTVSPLDWTGLNNGTAYRFQARACNPVGCSAWSATSPSATPYRVPSEPGAPGVSSQNNAIAVSWGAPASNGSAISRYELNYGSTTTDVGGATSRTVSFGQDGSERSFRVRACNAAGCGAYSGWSGAVRPKTIQLVRGGAAASGYWYNTTVTGPVGWAATLLCNDGVDLAFWSQTFSVPGGGVYQDTTLCYSGDLNPHWVNAGSLESNRVNW